jgi:hypothetical protein
MHKLIWIAPILLWAGCSKTKPASVAESGALAANPSAVQASQAAAPSAPKTTTIAAGTPLHVRLDESINTRANRAGDRFTASLSTPVEVNGRMLLPSGTRLKGHVTRAAASGRLKGRAVIGLTLDSIDLGGREFRVRTSSIDREGDRHKKRNGILIGGGTALGGVIGAIAGGPKGALIGAGAGAGAGTAGAALTGKKQIGLQAETPLRFVLEAPVEIPAS